MGLLLIKTCMNSKISARGVFVHTFCGTASASQRRQATKNIWCYYDRRLEGSVPCVGLIENESSRHDRRRTHVSKLSIDRDDVSLDLSAPFESFLRLIQLSSVLIENPTNCFAPNNKHFGLRFDYLRKRNCQEILKGFFSRSRQSEKGNIQKSVKKGNEIMQGSKSVVIQTRQDQNTEKNTEYFLRQKQVHACSVEGTCFHGKTKESEPQMIFCDLNNEIPHKFSS